MGSIMMKALHEQHVVIMHTNTKNFLIQKCASCEKEMHVGEGDTIYGGNWFHDSCWKRIENNIS